MADSDQPTNSGSRSVSRAVFGDDSGPASAIQPGIGNTTRLARSSRELQLLTQEEDAKPRSLRSMPDSAYQSSLRRTGFNGMRSHPLVWLSLGCAISILAQGCGWFFFANAAAWHGSLLFCLCGLGGYIYPVFKRNTDDIWSGRERPAVANWLLARDLASLAGGLLIGYAVVPMTVGVDRYVSTLTGIGDLVAAHRAAMHGVGPGSIVDLFVHNIRVFAAFFLISLLFRYLGLLFVVLYNAALWGVLGIDLILGSSLTTDGWSVGRGLVVAIAMAPHTIIEITAYVMAAMGGVFAGRCVMKYTLGSVAFAVVCRAILRLLLTGVLVLFAAAVTESLIAGSIVSWISDSDQRLPHLHPHDDDHQHHSHSVD